MHAIWPCDFEVVQELNGLEAILVLGIAVARTLQQLYFVGGRLRVVLGRFDNFERDKTHRLKVPAQPDGGEVAPAKFAENVIALRVQVTF